MVLLSLAKHAVLTSHSAGLPSSSIPKHEQVLTILVPHLHIALTRIQKACLNHPIRERGARDVHTDALQDASVTKYAPPT